jgi:hypothetical protein
MSNQVKSVEILGSWKRTEGGRRSWTLEFSLIYISYVLNKLLNFLKSLFLPLFCRVMGEDEIILSVWCLCVYVSVCAHVKTSREFGLWKIANKHIF